MSIKTREKRFVKFLEELGYPHQVQETQVSRIFNSHSLRIEAFIEWLQEKYNPSNSLPHRLTPSQMEIYLQLMKDGKLLEGDALDHAEKAQKLADDNYDQSTESLEDIENDVQELEYKIQKMEEQLARTSSRKEKLSSMIQQKREHSKRSTKYALQHQEAALTKTCQELLESQDELNESISTISTILDDLNCFLCDEEQERDAEYASRVSQWKQFLFNLDIESYTSREMEYLKQIKLVFEERMRVGSAPNNQNQEQDQNQDTSRPFWFHETNPMDLNLGPEKAALYDRLCLELSRLQQSYPVAEMEHIKQLILQAMLSVDEEGSTGSFSSTEPETMTREEKLQAIELAKSQRRTLMESSLPALCEKLAYLENTSVLMGDYEKKLNRLTYRLEVQQKIGALLDAQRGRLQHIMDTMEREEDLLQMLFRVLDSMLCESERALEEMNHRLIFYEQFDKSTKHVQAKEQNSISQPDRLLQYTASLLQQHQHSGSFQSPSPSEDGSEKKHSQKQKSVQTFNELDQLLSELVSRVHSEEKDLQQQRESMKDRVKQAEACLRDLRVAFFDSARSDQPLIESKRVTEQMQTAEECTEFVEKGVSLAFERLEQYKQIVYQTPSFQYGERDVFVEFVRDAESLIQKLESIESLQQFSRTGPPFK